MFFYSFSALSSESQIFNYSSQIERRYTQCSVQRIALECIEIAQVFIQRLKGTFKI